MGNTGFVPRVETLTGTVSAPISTLESKAALRLPVPLGELSFEWQTQANTAQYRVSAPDEPGY